MEIYLKGCEGLIHYSLNLCFFFLTFSSLVASVCVFYVSETNTERMLMFYYLVVKMLERSLDLIYLTYLIFLILWNANFFFYEISSFF